MTLRNAITTIVLLSSLSRFGLAQSPPDAPSAQVDVAPSTSFQTSYRNDGPAAPARRPWLDPMTADSTYWATTGGLFSTTFVNVEMTARCAEQHTCLTGIATGSSRLKLYAYTLPADIALSYLTYKLKPTKRWWAVPDLIFTAANLFSAGRSYDRIR